MVQLQLNEVKYKMSLLPYGIQVLSTFTVSVLFNWSLNLAYGKICALKFGFCYSSNSSINLLCLF